MGMMQNSLQMYEGENKKLLGQLQEMQESNFQLKNQVFNENRVQMENLAAQFLLAKTENERLHGIVNELYENLERMKEKYERQEEFFNLKNNDEIQKLSQQNAEYQEAVIQANERGRQQDFYINQLVEENNQLKRNIENDLNNVRNLQYNEQKYQKVYNDYEKMLKKYAEKDQEVQQLTKQMQDFAYDQNNSQFAVQNMQNKMQFLKAENDRLNRILLDRFKENSYW